MTGLPACFATCPGRLHGGGEERPDDELGALRDRLLGGLARPLGGAAVVLHQDRDVGVLELADRKVGGVTQRGRGDGALALPGQRQDQRDLDRARSDRAGVAVRRVGRGGRGRGLGDGAVAARRAAAEAAAERKRRGERREREKASALNQKPHGAPPASRFSRRAATET